MAAIIECRDRGAVADVTWVEQVVTKARDLDGSPAVVLVSTSGFTEPAQIKAAAYDHDVRVVTEVRPEEFRSWFHMEHAVQSATTRELHGCDIQLAASGTAQFSADTTRALESHGLDAAILQRQSLGPLSPRQIFDEWYASKRGQIMHNVPVGGSVRRKVTVRFENPAESLALETTQGRQPVATIDLDVEIVREEHLVPASRATHYRDASVELGQTVEFQLGDEIGTIYLLRTPDGTTQVRHRPPDS